MHRPGRITAALNLQGNGRILHIEWYCANRMFKRRSGTVAELNGVIPIGRRRDLPIRRFRSVLLELCPLSIERKGENQRAALERSRIVEPVAHTVIHRQTQSDVIALLPYAFDRIERSIRRLQSISVHSDNGSSGPCRNPQYQRE